MGAMRIPVVTDLVDVDSDKWTQYAGHARFRDVDRISARRTLSS